MVRRSGNSPGVNRPLRRMALSIFAAFATLIIVVINDNCLLEPGF
jgi:hypothetical protein